MDDLVTERDDFGTMLDPSMAKKPTRRPGRPKNTDEADYAQPGEKRVIYVEAQAELWNRLTSALDRARKRTGFNVSRSDFVRVLIGKALDIDEAESREGKPPA